MQKDVNNMCEKFHYDRLRNDRALGYGKSDNNKKNNNNKKKNVRSVWRPVCGSIYILVNLLFVCSCGTLNYLSVFTSARYR